MKSRYVVWAMFLAPLSAAHAADSATAPTAQTAAPATIALEPVDGMTISVPAGWIACDDASNKQLGQGADPLAMRAAMCAPLKPGATMTFGAFDPRPARAAAVFAGIERNNPLTADAIANLTPAVLSSLQATTCPTVTRPFTDTNSRIDSCTVAIGALGGHTAIVYTVLFTPGAAPQLEVELWAVPCSKGVLDFNLEWTKRAEPADKPELDALKASVQLQ